MFFSPPIPFYLIFKNVRGNPFLKKNQGDGEGGGVGVREGEKK